MKTFCPIDKSPLVAISREKTVCKKGCDYQGNIKQLYENGVALVWNEFILAYVDKFRNDRANSL